jgi:hypothetical protein
MTNMALKEQKTAAELEALILVRSQGMNFQNLEVRPEPTFGWAAYVVADPKFVADYDQRVSALCDELRELYDLKPPAS